MIFKIYINKLKKNNNLIVKINKEYIIKPIQLLLKIKYKNTN